MPSVSGAVSQKEIKLKDDGNASVKNVRDNKDLLPPSPTWTGLKVRPSSSPVVIYISTILCTLSVVCALLLLRHAHETATATFRQNLQSDFAASEIRRITRSVLQQELSWLYQTGER